MQTLKQRPRGAHADALARAAPTLAALAAAAERDRDAARAAPQGPRAAAAVPGAALQQLAACLRVADAGTVQAALQAVRVLAEGGAAAGPRPMQLASADGLLGRVAACLGSANIATARDAAAALAAVAGGGEGPVRLLLQVEGAAPALLRLLRPDATPARHAALLQALTCLSQLVIHGGDAGCDAATATPAFATFVSTIYIGKPPAITDDWDTPTLALLRLAQRRGTPPPGALTEAGGALDPGREYNLLLLTLERPGRARLPARFARALAECREAEDDVSADSSFRLARAVRLLRVLGDDEPGLLAELARAAPAAVRDLAHVVSAEYGSCVGGDESDLHDDAVHTLNVMLDAAPEAGEALAACPAAALPLLREWATDDGAADYGAASDGEPEELPMRVLPELCRGAAAERMDEDVQAAALDAAARGLTDGAPPGWAAASAEAFAQIAQSGAYEGAAARHGRLLDAACDALLRGAPEGARGGRGRRLEEFVRARTHVCSAVCHILDDWCYAASAVRKGRLFAALVSVVTAPLLATPLAPGPAAAPTAAGALEMHGRALAAAALCSSAGLNALLECVDVAPPRGAGPAPWAALLAAAPSLLQGCASELAAQRRRRCLVQPHAPSAAGVAGGGGGGVVLGGATADEEWRRDAFSAGSMAGRPVREEAAEQLQQDLRARRRRAEVAEATHTLCSALLTLVTRLLVIQRADGRWLFMRDAPRLRSASSGAAAAHADKPGPDGAAAGAAASGTAAAAVEKKWDPVRAAVGAVGGCSKLTQLSLLAAAAIEARRAADAAAAAGDAGSARRAAALLCRPVYNEDAVAEEGTRKHDLAFDWFTCQFPDCAADSPLVAALRVRMESELRKLRGGGSGGAAGAAPVGAAAPELRGMGAAACLAFAPDPALSGAAGGPLPCAVCAPAGDASAKPPPERGCSGWGDAGLDAGMRALFAAPVDAGRSCLLACLLEAAAEHLCFMGEDDDCDSCYFQPLAPSASNAAHGGRLQGRTAAPAACGTAAPRSGRTRGCAYCGKTSAQGAALRRCAGCGVLTGVRYCSQACCRNHWVRTGHRQQCEEAQRQLRERTVQQQSQLGPSAAAPG